MTRNGIALLWAAIPAFVLVAISTSVPAADMSHGPVVGRANAARLTDPGKFAGTSRTIRMIESRFERCFEASNDPPPTPPVGQCQDEAVGAYDALLPRTQKRFEAFLQDLSEPIDVRLTGGEKAIAIENAIGSAMMDLARARATIVTGGVWRPRHPARRHPSLTRLFGQLPDLPLLGEHHVARRLQQRWVKLRNGDCAAHPVPHCAARLDAAMTEVLDSILNDR